MIYTDTRDKTVKTSFKNAVLGGMNEKTGGLYIPVEFPKLDKSFLDKAASLSFTDVAFEMIKPYVDGEIPEGDLKSIIEDAYPFNAPLVKLNDNTFILELFHGPTCAFKDFGARFMARVMSYFNKDESTPLHILVATSGDTGSAVGSAFHNVPGLDVTILYPEGKVSKLQEKQLSTFDGNVKSLKVKGTFDDCQKLVKTAFTDNELRSKLRLSSANSINISRLLPQAFYYMYAAIQAKKSNPSKAVICIVPSGNFGNLTSGLIAREMGAPIDGFVAATNSNHTIPDWIATGDYNARPSVETYANAMDVGAPSNYERIQSMYTLEQVRNLFGSYWLDNDGIMDSIKDCYQKTNYTIDPHGAVGFKAWSEIYNEGFKNLKSGIKNDYTKVGITPNLPSWADKVIDKNAIGIILETAHPAKFGSTVKQATASDPQIPERLEKVLSLPDRAISMNNDYNEFKSWLLKNL